MYSRIIAEVRKEENSVWISILLLIAVSAYFHEYALIIFGGASVFLLFEIMIRLQAIIKILREDKE